jgi:hypothetical protein
LKIDAIVQAIDTTWIETSALLTKEIDQLQSTEAWLVPASACHHFSANWSNEMQRSQNFFVLIFLLFSACTDGLKIPDGYQPALSLRESTKQFKHLEGPYHAFYDVDGTVCVKILFFITDPVRKLKLIICVQIYDGTMAHCAWWFAVALPNPVQRISKACQVRFLSNSCSRTELILRCKRR